MRMLPSRPLTWAKGTDFNPLYDDCNRITIKIGVGKSDLLAKYRSLTEWMTENVNAGEATLVSLPRARDILNTATPYVYISPWSDAD
jgi:hypothetical protein